MTDRELLELAAKAFGFGKQNPPDNTHCWTASEYPKGSGKHGALWNYVGHADTAELWNPLSDDGDALRLAVYLFRDIHFWYFDNSVSVGNEQPTQPDPVEISEAIDAAVEMIERMEWELRLIAETDPIDAALDPQRAIRIARAALEKSK